MKRLLPLLLLLLLSVSCMSEDDASDVVVLVTPSTRSVPSGGKMYFTIKAWTLHERLTELNISSFDEINGEQKLDSRSIDTKEYSTEFHYTAPTDCNTVEMRFSASDNLGNTGLMKCIVTISDNTPLKEIKGIKMYSPFSGKEDAFSISELKAVKSGSGADIYAYGDSSVKDVLTKEWRANGNVRFCRSNEFKYDEADAAMLKNSYKSLKKTASIGQLNAGDIILIGYGENDAAGVVKITSVSDNAGYDEDHYEFSIKVTGN